MREEGETDNISGWKKQYREAGHVIKRETTKKQEYKETDGE